MSITRSGRLFSCNSVEIDSTGPKPQPNSIATTGAMAKVTKADLQESEKRILQQIGTAIKDALKEELQELNITEVKENSSEALDKANKTEENIDALKNRISVLEEESQVKDFVIADMRDRLERLETRDRRFNVKIVGIPETFKRLRQVVEELFADLKVEIDVYSDCDGIYRQGALKDKDQGPRPIVVELSRNYLKGEIYTKKAALKQPNNPLKTKWAGVDIYDDLTIPDNNVRREFSNIAQAARNAGEEHVKAKNKSVKIGDEIFTQATLHKLPPEYQPENIKCYQDENKVCFQGPQTVLSNLAPVEFVFNGRPHKTVDHCLYYTGARAAGEHKLAIEIRATKDPFVVKRISKHLHKHHTWKQTINQLEDMMRAKFLQNTVAGNKLQATGDKAIYEATKDPYWGIGHGLDDIASIGPRSKGKNKCGELLVKLRDELFK